MVGLADIPIVGKLVDRISDAAVETIFRGFRYMFFYKNLVKTLDSQVEKANTEEERVSRKVAAERANGKLIEPHVDRWQKKAEEIKESAEKFAEEYKNRHSWRCIQCLPIPNPVSRFRLGREAVKKTEELTELINSGKELLANEIAHLAPNENLPKSNTEFQEFQSRKDSYGELWRALTTDSSPIVGIYGMPGVGKTRMMEQIWKEAHEKNIFNKVTRANVGNEKLDVIQLQKQIAGYLDCNFVSEDNAESRAAQLKQSLLNAGKTLVILDDVWREIPLDVIGIPSGDGNSSKILLTSREENVCRHNNCKTLVKITPLRYDEAWDQFKNIVGSAQIDYMQDESLAKKVCDKCGGLPLLIHAIGKALQFETHNSWVDALQQLEKGEFVNIPGVEKQVYACVELSINKLHSDAKSCLFLCCLFPEDYNIPIERLIQLATGSELVSGESRVLSMVDTLISSSLLLDCENDDNIKLHDVIRDVGKSIALGDRKFAFLQVTCDVRLPHDADFLATKFLRLDLGGDDIHIPGDLVCPDLHSLWIQFNDDIQQFSGGIFNMSANLRFLYLVDSYPFVKLQFSLQPLGKLRTMIFYRCDLSVINNTNGGFFPKYLETLCISYGDLPQPLDLSNLKYLRKLEIKGLRVVIMPNTISSLSGLEQLHIPGGFEIWREDSSAVAKSIFVEINTLTHLKSLQLKFETSELFEDTKIVDNLKLFNIFASGGWSYRPEANLSYKTSIELEGYSKKSPTILLEKAEYVNLVHSDINEIDSIFANNRELRKLHIEECNEMEHLARMSQGEIQLSQQTSFSRLTFLEIKSCSTLRYLFCNSVAKCLTQLQKLIIQDCPLMEAIIMNDGSSNGDIISFSQLKELDLSKVQRLRTFYGENKNAIMQPSAQFRPLFHRMVEFPSLEILKIYLLEDARDIWERDYNNDSRSFCKLKSFSIQECSRVETVIPVVMLHKLQNLQTLSIHDCSSVISQVGRDDKNIDVWPLLALSAMYLLELPCLEETGLNLRNSSTATNLYPNLKTLKISRCNNLKNVFGHSSVLRSVMHLEELNVGKCKMMREIIGDNGQEEITHVSVFPKLKNSRSEQLPTLSGYKEAEEAKVEFSGFRSLQQLQELEISDRGFLEEIAEDDNMSGMNKKTITLPPLKDLVLTDLPKLKSIIHGANYEWRVPSLRGVIVWNCGLSTLFSFSEFTSLECLYISSCPDLEEIVEDNNRSDEVSGMNKKTITLSRLESVTLHDLPKLKSFIYCANHAYLLLPSLSSVSVTNCGLSSLFMCSAAFRSLQRLDYLEVRDCRMLEGIFECAREDETFGTSEQIIISLPKLSSLELQNLPDLKSFIHGANYDCYMPALEKMTVENCGFSTLFTCSVFRSLLKLSELKVSDCILLEDIVEDARGDDTNDKSFTLHRLESFKLEDLPNLKSFCRDEIYAFNMPALMHMKVDNCGFSTLFTCSVFRNLLKLIYLEVSNCRLLEVIVGDARDDDTNDKTFTLHRLGRLELEDLPNLKSFSRDESYAFNMPALMRMKVDNCGFFTLFTCSVFRNLQELSHLEVSNCRLLEVVVEDARGDETPGTNDMTVTLPKLSIIKLEHLPNLKSFSRDESIAFNMPALRLMEVDNCGFSTLFTYSVLRTLQKLRELKVYDCRLLEVLVADARGDETSDTNDKTITLPLLESVELWHLPNLISFSRDESIAFNMPALNYMGVDNCGFSTLFTCSVFRNLQQLRELKISNCRLLEVLVADARGDETSDTNDKTITLPLLKSLLLGHLPNLISFSRDESIAFNMPALDSMGVDNCGFSTLFKCSVFRNLLKLRVLEVVNCRLLEVVVGDARDDGTNDKTITLPLLECFQLSHLPNLKSFSHDESIAFNMLKLEYFGLVRCPGVENFTCLNTRTGKGYVCSDGHGDDWTEVPDLSDYIKSLFKKEDIATPENQKNSKMKSLGDL